MGSSSIEAVELHLDNCLSEEEELGSPILVCGYKLTWIDPTLSVDTDGAGYPMLYYPPDNITNLKTTDSSLIIDLTAIDPTLDSHSLEDRSASSGNQLPYTIINFLDPTINTTFWSAT